MALTGIALTASVSVVLLCCITIIMKNFHGLGIRMLFSALELGNKALQLILLT